MEERYRVQVQLCDTSEWVTLYDYAWLPAAKEVCEYLHMKRPGDVHRVVDNNEREVYTCDG